MTWLKPRFRPAAWFVSEPDESGDGERRCDPGGAQLAWYHVATRRLPAVGESGESGEDDGAYAEPDSGLGNSKFVLSE